GTGVSHSSACLIHSSSVMYRSSRASPQKNSRSRSTTGIPPSPSVKDWKKRLMISARNGLVASQGSHGLRVFSSPQSPSGQGTETLEPGQKIRMPPEMYHPPSG